MIRLTNTSSPFINNLSFIAIFYHPVCCALHRYQIHTKLFWLRNQLTQGTQIVWIRETFHTQVYVWAGVKMFLIKTRTDKDNLFDSIFLCKICGDITLIFLFLLFPKLIMWRFLKHVKQIHYKNITHRWMVVNRHPELVSGSIIYDRCAIIRVFQHHDRNFHESVTLLLLE